MPRFTTDRVPHCCSLETRQSQGTSCSAEITQTEEMRIQKGCLQWQQMVLNNSEYLWVIPHSRDVSRDWHPTTLCARKLPMHPVQSAMGAPLTGRHQESGSFRATGCRKSGQMLPSYSMLWSFTSCPGSDNEVLFGRVPSVELSVLLNIFFATCRFVVRGSNLEKLTKRFKEGCRAWFNL